MTHPLANLPLKLDEKLYITVLCECNHLYALKLNATLSNPYHKRGLRKTYLYVSLTVVDIGPVGLVTYAILVCVNNS